MTQKRNSMAFRLEKVYFVKKYLKEVFDDLKYGSAERRTFDVA
jgi:hypothetical protein